MMGETGQGCMSEEDIEEKNNPNLMRTWGECLMIFGIVAELICLLAEVKKRCPWYFTLKGLISERPNLVPVGLGNNATEYDTSVLAGDQGTSEAGPTKMGDGPLDSDELKETVDDQELDNTPIDTPDLNTKAANNERKASVKKEHTIPAKRPRSQVDRIADTEIARLDCKKARLEIEQERLKSVQSVAVARAQEKTHRVVEVRQAELAVEREKIQMEHEYRMEMLKRGHIPPLSSVATTSLHGFQPYPAAWNFVAPLPNSQTYAAPQSLTPPKGPPSEGFPARSLDRHSGGGSPRSRPDLFDGSGC